jgi:signal transduction histidine kinase
MAPGIRTKLLTSFVLVIVLPVMVIAAGLFYSMSQWGNDTGNEQIERIQQVNQIVVQEIINGHHYLKDGDAFYVHIKPLLDKYNLELHIEGLGGETYFDSTVYDSGWKEESPKLWDRMGRQASTSTIPIVIQNEVAANATLISHDPSLTGFVGSIYSSMFFSLIMGIITLVVLVVIFTFYISRSVLNPLQVLNEAAENIASGNLDHEIKYRAKDELGRFSRTFEQMRIKLRESLRKQHAIEMSRKEMVAGISHDLRTPIASIKGYVEGLQDGVVTDREMTERYLAVIKDKTEKLDRLIDELFRFAQLDLGNVDINLRNEDSKELLESIFSGYELEMGDSFMVERPLPSVPVEVDKHKIEQVVDNIVQNARRHSEGEAKITAGARVRDAELVVSVCDDGPGIAPNDLPHIFERFYRGEKSRSRNFGGTGLGLAISKYIIETHGGRIWAESESGRGISFHFSLPLRAGLEF